MNPLSGLERTLGKDVFHKIQNSNILCVGSGGIGCELLKDLALCGFRRVEVIDLDTIDVSNLNRQLLFRGQHVGMPKCTVGCEVAANMVPPLSTSTAGVGNDNVNLPSVSYRAHHGNVCDTTKFNVPFVKNFDLVLNALDNVEARRRVNRLCLAADVPLIEAGTTGYLGQVTVIHKSSGVACYECATKETQKVYPICTIRSTPSMPVHTIVWSKELYKLLFHSKVGESMLFEDPEGSEASTYMASVSNLRKLLKNDESDDACSSKDFSKAVRNVLHELYSTEIQKQLDMGRYKAAKKTPTCIDATVLDKGVASTKPPSSTTAVWSTEESVTVLVACLVEAKNTPNENLLEEFDKDDDMAMRFVTAASNMRSSLFGIEPLQSLYSAKGIAGNIIPAIATTNAICAGLQILQAFSVLKQKVLLEQERSKSSSNEEGTGLNLKESGHYINCLRNRTRNGLYLTAVSLENPNPNCFVCKNAIIPLTLDVNEWTLQELLQRVIKGRLGFEQPTLMLQGDFIWEEGDGADEEEFKGNLSKKLSQLPCGGIQHGTVLEIDDASQNLNVCVSVTNQEEWEGKTSEDFPFITGALPPQKKDDDEDKKPAMSSSSGDNPNNRADDDDDVVLITEEEIDVGKSEHEDKKRSIEEDADVERRTKKARKEPSKADDSMDGLIEIDN